MIQLIINNRQYNVKEARTGDEKKRGLQKVKELPEDGGMLFYYEPPQTADIWMKNTYIPLDIVFINDDFEVMKVAHGKPRDTVHHHICPNTSFVLEVNANSGIKVGDEMELEPTKGPVMKVLLQDGRTQTNLWGGERIFRRPFTRQIIDIAKKAKVLRKKKSNLEELNRLYARLGRKMFKEIRKQDTREPEYVDAPN